MYVLNHQGDTAIEWDVANKEATEIAEKKFNELRSSGHMMVEVKEGVGDEQVNTFDPKAEEIVAVRPIQGG